MRIAVVTNFYSEGMGYTENCLPKALVELGHDVDVITSNLNVYGNEQDYEETYAAFLGPADQGTGRFRCDGYTVHRLESGRLGGYVVMRGLAAEIRTVKPEIVHCTEIASLQTFHLAALRLVSGYRLFTETHQHLSVVRPYMKNPGGPFLKKGFYRLTRTLPTWVSSLAVERCYAISPDCARVARTYYGVPGSKLSLRSLGTDTTLFHPAKTPEEAARRSQTRRGWGYGPDDVVCIYTGRFSHAKNPLVLARAVASLADAGLSYHSLFVGEGDQKEAIASCRSARVLPFAKHAALADLYRMADIAVWPRQESMSMLDAAATGIPIVASTEIGESDRIVGNGRVYQENSVEDLARVLSGLASAGERKALGAAGRAKMEARYSWAAIARAIEGDFASALGNR
jgi:glycosyltransferase involved in cell wall biosynthesis